MAAVRMCTRFARGICGLNKQVPAQSCLFRLQAQRNSSSSALGSDPDKKCDAATDIEVESNLPADDSLLIAQKAFEEEKEKLTKQVADFQDKYKRSLAETENVRRRMQKQIDDAKLFGIQGFCKDLLEVADILRLATDNVPKDELQSNSHLKSMFEGLTMTDVQMQKVFTKHGLIQINPAEGEQFNPNVHEALFQQPSPEGKESDTVAVVTKIGYQLHSRTVRPALVGVFK